MLRLFLTPLVLGLLASTAMAQSANNAGQAPAAAAPAGNTPPAAAPAVKRVPMRALLTSGYEIKAVTLVPQDVASRVAHALDLDAAMVTLQKGSTAATCYLSVEQFSTPGMLDIAWCIEHK